MLWRVTAPHFVCGIVTEGDVVVEAAPILRWSIGKTRQELRRYFARKRWGVQLVRGAP